MKKQQATISIFTALLLVIAATLPLQVQAQEMTINEILKELAGTSTQGEAEIAIRHLFDKIGIGKADESKYEYYNLSNENMSSLANAHIRFLKGESVTTTIRSTYKEIKSFVNIYNGVKEL